MEQLVIGSLFLFISVIIIITGVSYDITQINDVDNPEHVCMFTFGAFIGILAGLALCLIL